MSFRAARVLSLSLLTVGLLATSVRAEDLAVGDLLRPTAASWFRVTGPDGAIIGFGRLEYGPEESEYVVKLHIGIEMRGQRHEESQEMRLDMRTLRMMSHRIALGDSEIRGTRIDDGFRVDAGDERATITLDEDAACISLVFAAMMPGREGTTFARSVADPRKGYAVSGKFHLETRSPETFKTESGAVETRRYELKSPDGRAYSIWVDAAHAVVRVDLPGGIRLLKSAKSTEHLFVKKEPVLVEVADGPKDRLTMVGRLPKLSPEQAFAHFVDPSKMKLWWAPKLAIDAKVGGVYEPSWPAMEWTLKGKIRAFEPGKRFGFTWVWGHSPEGYGPYDVDIRFAADEAGGTRITISHGPYGDGAEEAKERAGHRAGWLSFIGALAARDPAADEPEEVVEEPIDDDEMGGDEEEEEIEEEEVEEDDGMAAAEGDDLASAVALLARLPNSSDRDDVRKRILASKPGWTDLTNAIEALPFSKREAATIVVKELDCMDGVVRPWALSVPPRYDPRVGTPLIVVLHGGVSRPNVLDDPKMYATGGSPLSVLAQRRGWLAAFPMGQNGATWWDAVGIANVRNIVRAVKSEYNVDDDRVWLGGFSDGASGAFLYSMIDSTDYAGLIAMNGHLGVGNLAGGISTFPSNMANVPVYATTTFSDALYPSAKMRPTIAMAVEAGARIRYREMPGGHNYEPMYGELPAVGRWLDRCVRNPLPARVVCETADLAYGKQRWFVIDGIDLERERASWHVDHNVELTDDRIAIGFYHDQEYAGVRVARIVEDSLAATIGLKPGDVILRAGETEIGSIEDLSAWKGTLERGDEVTLHVNRGGDAKTTLALTGKIPPPSKFALFQKRGEPAMAIATVGGNVIDVKTSRVGSFRVLIHPDLVRLDQPLKIVVDGKTVHDALVKPDPEFMLANFLKNRDRRLLYVAEISVDLGDE